MTDRDPPTPCTVRPMRFAHRFPIPSCLLIAGLLLLGACDSRQASCGVDVSCATGEPTLACDLQAGPDSKNFPMTVQYSASLSGDARILELTYLSNAGTQRTDTLTTAWSTEVHLDSGRNVEVTADVEMTGGSAKVDYVARDSTGEVSIRGSDQCGTN